MQKNRRFTYLDFRWDIFLKLYDTKSFSKVASSFNVSQPAISKAVAQLENELGITLFDRQVRPIIPTKEATLLREQIIKNLLKIENVIQGLQCDNFIKPCLRFGCTESTGRFIAPAIAIHYQKQLSKFVQLSGNSQILVDKLIKREADVILVCDPYYEQPGLIRKLIYQEPSVLALPKDIANRHSSWAVENLQHCGLPMIASLESSGAGRLNERILQQITLFSSNRYEVESDAVMVEMLNAGLGWAITRPSTLLASENKDNIRLCPMQQSLEPLPYYLMIQNPNLQNDFEEIAVLCLKQFNEKILPQCLVFGTWLKPLYKTI